MTKLLVNQLSISKVLEHVYNLNKGTNMETKSFDIKSFQAVF
jgi:hypothetical protein